MTSAPRPSAAGVAPDDEGMVPAPTFIASANTVRYCGAWPLLLDVEPGYFQLDPDRLEGFLRNECTARSGGLHNRGSGRRVRAVMPVHLLGHPCDMQAITRIARHYGLMVVEAEALGARHLGRPVASAGDVACFSFNGNKIVTSGGGIIVTADAGLAARARYLTTQAKDDPVEGVHGAVGFNYRLTRSRRRQGWRSLNPWTISWPPSAAMPRPMPAGWTAFPGSGCRRRRPGPTPLLAVHDPHRPERLRHGPACRPTTGPG